MNEEKIRSFLKQAEIGALFLLDERKPFYYDSAYIKEPDNEDCERLIHEVKAKTCFDEVFIYTQKGRYLSDLQFMYIPLEKGCLRFKEWQKSFEPVYIANGGKDILEVKTPYGVYAIPSEKIVRCHRDEYTYRKEGFSDPKVDTIDYGFER